MILKLMQFFFATTADFIQTRQKRKQLSSQKHIQNNWEAWYFQMRALAMQIFVVLSSKTLTKYQALSDLLRSLIVSRVPLQILSIA